MMKIVTKDNYDRDIFEEVVVAENINKYWGEELVARWNNKYWNSQSDYYLALVEDDYKCYNGYELHM